MTKTENYNFLAPSYLLEDCITLALLKHMSQKLELQLFRITEARHIEEDRRTAKGTIPNITLLLLMLKVF